MARQPGLPRRRIFDARFATVCGYTRQDLETDFGARLEGMDWDRLKQWGNGYGFLGNPALAQIRPRGYSAKSRGLPSKGLIELGLAFDRGARNREQADWASMG
jgi:hypothetical protein